jgi:hypothetical protein
LIGDQIVFGAGNKHEVAGFGKGVLAERNTEATRPSGALETGPYAQCKVADLD